MRAVKACRVSTSALARSKETVFGRNQSQLSRCVTSSSESCNSCGHPCIVSCSRRPDREPSRVASSDGCAIRSHSSPASPGMTCPCRRIVCSMRYVLSVHSDNSAWIVSHIVCSICYVSAIASGRIVNALCVVRPLYTTAMNLMGTAHCLLNALLCSFVERP